MTDETDRHRHDPFAPAPRRDRATTQQPSSLTGAVTPHEPLPEHLERLNKPDLVELAQKRGLPTDGTKADLVARLRAA